MAKNVKKENNVQKISSRNRNKNKNQSMQMKVKEKRLSRSVKEKNETINEELEKTFGFKPVSIDKIDADVYFDHINVSDNSNDDNFVEVKPRKFVVVDDDKQNKVSKFEFISREKKIVKEKKKEQEELELDDTFNYIGTRSDIAVDLENEQFETTSGDEYIIPPTDNVDINARRYFSFESRIILFLVIIIVSFFSAGLLIYKSITSASDSRITYKEKSIINYSVCINDSNNYYQDSCLDEDMQYITNIVDKIPVKFEYEVNYNKSIDSMLNYYAVSKITIYNEKGGKILHTTEEVLLERTSYSVVGENANILLDVVIPYGDYSRYVQKYNEQYNVSSYAVVDIDFYVDNGNLIKKAANLNMALTDLTFSIEKTEVANDKLNMSIIDGETYGINSSYALVGIIFVLFGLIAIIRLSNLVYKITATASLYDKKLQRILREYDRLIVISRGDYIVDESKRLIKVTSFRELLDARNTLEKPIVYVRINNVKSEFYVEDSEAIYKYTMKEADFEGK